ncbi:MAG: tetratricopeptide repeat protein [Gammaproteobacteria bacterium]
MKYIKIYPVLISRFIYLVIFFVFVYPQVIYADTDTFKEGGIAYKKGDYKTAARKFMEVAKKGDHRAMYALGSMYAGGTGVEKDYKKAYKWFKGAAKYGRLDAQYKLGLMYEEGLGVDRNYKQAARLYSKVAKKGYAHAQFRFGMLYAQGHGVKQDNVKAYAWLAAAEQNFASELHSRKKPGGNIDVDISTVDENQPGDIFAPIHLSMITEELEHIRKKITPEQSEKAKLLAQKYIQY